MVEKDPSGSNLFEQGFGDLLATFAVAKAGELLKIDQETSRMTYADSQLPSDDYDIQVSRSMAHSLMNTIYHIVLSSKHPKLLDMDDPFEELLYITEHIGEIKNVESEHAQLDYRNDEGIYHRFIHAWVDIEDIGRAELATVTVFDPENVASYQVIVNANGDVFYCVQRDTVDENERLDPGIVHKVPPALLPQFYEVVQGQMSENQVEEVLDQFKEVAGITMDSYEVYELINEMNRLYDLRRKRLIDSIKSNSIIMTLEDLQDMHKVIDDRSRQIE